MPRSLHFTPFIIASFGLHLLLVAAAVYVASRADLSLPTLTPVDIVNLPQNVVAKLPPVDTRPVPPPASQQQRPIPERAPRPESVPGPKHFGSSPDISLPGPRRRKACQMGATRERHRPANPAA